MNIYKFFEVNNFLVISLSFSIHSANYGGHISKYCCMHQGANEHDDDGKYLFFSCVSRHISKTNCCQRRTGEI